MEQYQGIYKDGHYIRPMIQRIRKCQMDVLREINAVCSRHGIKWFAERGSLLGAIRHHGFIPWDDDLDISMQRSDFETFRRYAKEELPKEYVCCIDRGEQMKDMVFCISDGSQVNVEESFLESHHGCPYAVGVDIFIYDNIPDDEKERQDYLSMFSYTFAPAQEVGPGMCYPDCSDEIQGWIQVSENLTGRKMPRNKPLKGYLMTLSDQIAAMYYDVKTKYVAIAGTLPWGEKYLFDAEWFQNTIKMPFEDMEIRVPAGYENILTRWFGEDYMTPKQFQTHDSDVLRQEKELHRWFTDRGMEIPDIFRE